MNLLLNIFYKSSYLFTLSRNIVPLFYETASFFFTKVQHWILSYGMARPQVMCRKLGFQKRMLFANIFSKTPRAWCGYAKYTTPYVISMIQNLIED